MERPTLDNILPVVAMTLMLGVIILGGVQMVNSARDTIKLTAKVNRLELKVNDLEAEVSKLRKNTNLKYWKGFERDMMTLKSVRRVAGAVNTLYKVRIKE